MHREKETDKMIMSNKWKPCSVSLSFGIFIVFSLCSRSHQFTIPDALFIIWMCMCVCVRVFMSRFVSLRNVYERFIVVSTTIRFVYSFAVHYYFCLYQRQFDYYYYYYCYFVCGIGFFFLVRGSHFIHTSLQLLFRGPPRSYTMRSQLTHSPINRSHTISQQCIPAPHTASLLYGTQSVGLRSENVFSFMQEPKTFLCYLTYVYRRSIHTYSNWFPFLQQFSAHIRCVCLFFCVRSCFSALSSSSVPVH